MNYLEGIIPHFTTLVTIAVILLVAIILSRAVRWFINKTLLSAPEKSRGDATKYKFFKNAATLIIWVVALGAIVLLIPKLKALAITLFAGAGIFIAILGLAAQEAFSNIIAGIFIVIFKPFRVGDMIKVGSSDYGIVDDITLRHTIIINFENKRIIIPNSVISSETITNDSIEDLKVCRWVEVGISYDSDIDLAIKIMQEEALAHPDQIDGRTPAQIRNGDPKVLVRFMSFGESSIDLRAYVWTNNPFKAIQLHSDLNLSIKKRFDKEGIEIPFPYRTIVYKNQDQQHD